VEQWGEKKKGLDLGTLNQHEEGRRKNKVLTVQEDKEGRRPNRKSLRRQMTLKGKTKRQESLIPEDKEKRGHMATTEVIE